MKFDGHNYPLHELYRGDALTDERIKARYVNANDKAIADLREHLGLGLITSVTEEETVVNNPDHYVVAKASTSVSGSATVRGYGEGLDWRSARRVGARS